MERKRRTALIGRISTNLEAQKSSLVFQREKLEDYIKSKDDLIFNPEEDIYSEHFSGKKIDRKNSKFQELMFKLGVEIVEINNQDEIEFSIKVNKKVKPYYQYIVCKSTSRFARSFHTQHLFETLKEIGVEVYFWDIGESTFSPNADMLLNFLTFQDAKYSQKVSQNWKQSYWLYQQENQDLKLRSDLFGYQRVKKLDEELNKIKRYYVKKDDEYKILRQMVQMYLYERKGLYLISKWLKEEHGLKFTRKRVKDTLLNMHYCGMEKGYKFDEDYLKFKLDEEANRQYLENLESFWYPCKYIEVIITLEEHNQMEQLLNSRRNTYGTGQKIHTNPVSKLLYCGECGASYSSKGINNFYKERHWICLNYQRAREYHNEPTCKSNIIFENFVNEFLDNLIEDTQRRKQKIYKDNLNNLLYLRLHLANLLVKNDFNSYQEAVERVNELQENIANLYIEKVSKMGTPLEGVMDIAISKQEKEFTELKDKIEFLDNLESSVSLLISQINELYLKINRDYIANMEKKTNTKEEVMEELDRILVYSKPIPEGMKRKPRNNSVLVPVYKLEQEIFELLDSVFTSTLKNVLEKSTISQLQNKSKQKYFIVKKPTDQEIEDGNSLLRTMNLLDME